MNKVYCNKETDMVEQIINIDVDTRWDENWFPNCYVVDDHENKISTYNLKYNKEKEVFEIVEGLNPKDAVEVTPSANEKIEALEKENENLKKEIQEIKNMITQTFMKE